MCGIFPGKILISGNNQAVHQWHNDSVVQHVNPSAVIPGSNPRGGNFWGFLVAVGVGRGAGHF